MKGALDVAVVDVAAVGVITIEEDDVGSKAWGDTGFQVVGYVNRLVCTSEGAAKYVCAGAAMDAAGMFINGGRSMPICEVAVCGESLRFFSRGTTVAISSESLFSRRRGLSPH